MTSCVQLCQFCPRWWQDVLIAKNLIPRSQSAPSLHCSLPWEYEETVSEGKFVTSREGEFHTEFRCKHVTPVDKRMSYKTSC